MCLCGISSDFSLLSPSIRQVTHVLLTRPPLDNVSSGRSFPIRIPFDLHVLGTPPAFILSQDRTLIMSTFHKEKYVMYKTTAQAVPCKARLRSCLKATRRSNVVLSLKESTECTDYNEVVPCVAGLRTCFKARRRSSTVKFSPSQNALSLFFLNYCN